MRILSPAAVLAVVMAAAAIGCQAFVVPLRPLGSSPLAAPSTGKRVGVRSSQWTNPKPLRMPSSRTTVAKALRARGAAVAPAPVPVGSSISSGSLSLQQRQRLRPSLVRAAAAVAAPTGPQAGGGLLERMKAVVKGIGAGLPLVAFSTISGGVLAGSLHTVTGACVAGCGALAPPRASRYTRRHLTPHRPHSIKSTRRTGPDHLAALLPRCIGKRWYQAMRIGAVWGLGR